MDKQCLDCGNIIKGRADKKFCDDQCRSNYNNRIKATENHQILLKNWKILNALNPEGKTKLSKTRLIKEGYNFNYQTHNYQTKTGSNYVFCYDNGFLALENDWFLLVRNNEEG
jgi:predicted nucleic acid-binding Zn ribbon protein